jgi:uncharacterized MnhB-related membrane protein
VAVRVPAKTNVLPFLKIILEPGVVSLTLLNVMLELPEIVELSEALVGANTTVPLLWVKVPLLTKSPFNVRVPEGAVKVPALMVNVPPTVMEPPEVKLLEALLGGLIDS